ncbi:MAG: immunoglobulin domain-containing protein [Ignavibacteria bacterium]|nr:immunoglobulin domain-containing protein [Ignavibacteria bacterium]
MKRQLLFSFIVASAVVLMSLALSITDVKAQNVYCSYGYGSYTVSAPTSGAVFTQGDAMSVKWTCTYNPSNYSLGQEIYISTNGGSTWTFLQAVSPTTNNGGDTWTIPKTYATGTNFRLLVTDKPDNRSWYCNLNNNGMSGIFTILLGCAAPKYTTQIKAASPCVNTNHTISVTSGMTNGTYDWRKDGVIRATTTTPSYTINNIQLTDAGYWDVIGTDNCDRTIAFSTSIAALITVLEPPVVTVQPVATMTICEAGKNTLSVTASGASLTYQWRQNDVNLPGETGTSLLIDNAVSAKEGSYTCVVSGTCAPPATSNATVVTVILRPRIVQNPVSTGVCPGATATLSITTQPAPNLVYQWFRNLKPIVGANSTSLVLSNYDYNMDGQYQCVVTVNVPNPLNCVITANSAIADVMGYQGPVVKKSPDTSDVCLDGNITLKSQFDGPGLSYQWNLNGSPIPGANSNSLTLTNAKPSQAGMYTVTATTGTCNLAATAMPAMLNVLGKPSFTAQPTDQKLMVGDKLTLTATATDARMMQWTKDSKPIAGATGMTYTIDKVKMSDAGYYNVLVSNACAGGTSSAYAQVSVKDPSLDVPELTLSQNTAGLGEIPIGYSKSMTLTDLIQNTGLAPMDVTGISISGPGFEIVTSTPTPFTLNATMKSTVEFKTTPLAIGPQSGTITITTNAPNPTGTVTLTALSVLRYDNPKSSDYGMVEETKTKEQCIAINNTSGIDITLESITVGGTDASAFTVLTTMPLAIAAGATENVCVRFAPGTQGAKSGTLSVVSSTGGNSTIALTGEGVPTVGVEDAVAAGISVSPNPMRDNVEIRFGKPMATVNIDVISNNGQIVAQLTNQESSTSSVVRWNGQGANGAVVASGAYTIVVRTSNATYSIPLSIVR